MQLCDLVECVYEIQRVERIDRSGSRNLDVLDYGRILLYGGQRKHTGGGAVTIFGFL